MGSSLLTSQIGQRIFLPGRFDVPVVLEDARPLGSDDSAGYECRVRLHDGSLEETVISSEEVVAVLGKGHGEAKAETPVDAEKLRLLIESARVRLAYAHDQQFAVNLSGIRTLCRTRSKRYIRRCFHSPDCAFFWRMIQGPERRSSAALTRTVLQRRLVSSTCAIHESIKRRLKKQEDLLDELEGLTPAQRAKRLAALQGRLPDVEQDEDDIDDAVRDQLVDEYTAALELEQLRAEISALKELVEQARRVRENANDSKLDQMNEALEGRVFDVIGEVLSLRAFPRTASSGLDI